MVFSPPSLWTIGKDLHGEPAGSGRRFRTAGMSGTASERRTPPGGGGSYEHNPDSGRWTFCLVLGQIECQTPQPAEAEKIFFQWPKMWQWQPLTTTFFLCVTM